MDLCYQLLHFVTKFYLSPEPLQVLLVSFPSIYAFKESFGIQHMAFIFKESEQPEKDSQADVESRWAYLLYVGNFTCIVIEKGVMPGPS